MLRLSEAGRRFKEAHSGHFNPLLLGGISWWADGIGWQQFSDLEGSEKMKHGTGMKESPQEHVMGDSSLIGMDVAKRVDRTCKRMR